MTPEHVGGKCLLTKTKVESYRCRGECGSCCSRYVTPSCISSLYTEFESNSALTYRSWLTNSMTPARRLMLCSPPGASLDRAATSAWRSRSQRTPQRRTECRDPCRRSWFLPRTKWCASWKNVLVAAHGDFASWCLTKAHRCTSRQAWRWCSRT